MITVVLAFAVAACLPVLIHRSAFDAAFLRWTRNPTPENSSLLNEEAHRTQRSALQSEFEIGFLAFIGFNACWVLWEQMRAWRKSSKTNS